MKLAGVGEDALVARFASLLEPAADSGRSRRRDIEVGIGDDCAVLDCGGDELLLLKTDCVIEGVHFLRAHAPTKVGWKAVARVLSDIAAMGGTPRHALVTAALPPDLDLRHAEGIFRGIGRAAARFGFRVVGGETARSPGPVFLSIALTGSVARGSYATRAGACDGDAVFVTGVLGGSARGHHLSFTPRIDEGAWLVRKFGPTAMMDISDGLGTDLPRLARSSGLGFELDGAAVPRRRGCDLKAALRDGEDYELLFTLPAARERALAGAWKKRFPRVRLTRIGTMSRNAGREMEATGFDHFHR